MRDRTRCWFGAVTGHTVPMARMAIAGMRATRLSDEDIGAEYFLDRHAEPDTGLVADVCKAMATALRSLGKEYGDTIPILPEAIWIEAMGYDDRTSRRHIMAAIGIKETPSATTSELATAFDEWLDGLDTPQATLTKHSMEILARSMRKGMALRDAMLLSVICAGNPEYDKGKLRDYAAAPRIPNHQLSEWCERMMKWSFAHAGHETDKDKVANASRMLVDIVDTVEDTDLKLQAQPFAITSYILWWVGDERAMLAAMRALAIDEECSLAAIVAAAIHGDQWPNRN